MHKEHKHTSKQQSTVVLEGAVTIEGSTQLEVPAIRRHMNENCRKRMATKVF